MEEIGVVIKTLGRLATVSIPKPKGICEQCTMGGCNISGEGSEIEALNLAGAKEGQKVKVSMKAFSYTKGSLIVYGLPVLALILGAVIGKELALSHFKGSDPESVSAIFAFAAFGISFLLIKIWTSKAEKKQEYKPVIEEILD
ncbi:MAG: SoxR reducing system RseC family protein [Nitrospiraceae bacterium]|nr:SoxR reducing system RseC family protein [Nitrospiraceae bacterium]